MTPPAAGAGWLDGGVPTDHWVHLDRARAESFGSVAEQYDRFRPPYPDALFDDLVSSRPAQALDVGCGTGRVAVALMARAVPVLGVEADPRMAAVARGHGVTVELGAFEAWPDAGRTFDLITSGQAWHWVDPHEGPRKAARLLRPEGTLAVFWNFDEPEEQVRGALEAAYRAHAPELAGGIGSTRHDGTPYLEALETAGVFASVHLRTYRWAATYTTAEWVGRAATHSDHIRLPEARRAALLAAVAAELDRRGGAITTSFTTFAVLAAVGGAGRG